MRKGERTRQAILEHASNLARQVGLEGLTIGRLAQDLMLSKSGLFGYFQSKEALAVQMIEFAADRIVDRVVRPALAAPRGEPRVRALFERWLDWSRRDGCVFVALATELDDQPGPARDRLVRAQKDWMETIATCFRTGIAEGHFRADADAEQFAHNLSGIYLARHFSMRLLADPKADQRAHEAFEALLTAAREKPKD